MHAEGFCGLDILQFPQLEGLAAQQPTQPRPAADTQDEAEVKQTVPEQEHERSDQQDARNGSEGGVDILNGVIDPSPEIAGEYAEAERERDRSQRCEPTDDQCRPNPFQSAVEDIGANLVRPKEV